VGLTRTKASGGNGGGDDGCAGVQDYVWGLEVRFIEVIDQVGQLLYVGPITNGKLTFRGYLENLNAFISRPKDKGLVYYLVLFLANLLLILVKNNVQETQVLLLARWRDISNITRNLHNAIVTPRVKRSSRRVAVLILTGFSTVPSAT
jgi:hypothetical protein